MISPIDHRTYTHRSPIISTLTTVPHHNGVKQSGERFKCVLKEVICLIKSTTPIPVPLTKKIPCELEQINPISGRLLATPISGREGGGLFRTPLISPVLTGRFLKFKRHSFRLNMIYISKKRNLKNS